jgi:hypothetical protein
MLKCIYTARLALLSSVYITNLFYFGKDTTISVVEAKKNRTSICLDGEREFGLFSSLMKQTYTFKGNAPQSAYLSHIKIFLSHFTLSMLQFPRRNIELVRPIFKIFVQEI